MERRIDAVTGRKNAASIPPESGKSVAVRVGGDGMWEMWQCDTQQKSLTKTAGGRPIVEGGARTGNGHGAQNGGSNDFRECGPLYRDTGTQWRACSLEVNGRRERWRGSRLGHEDRSLRGPGTLSLFFPPSERHRISPLLSRTVV